MHHEAVAQVAALLGRDDLPQGHLHLLRLLDAIHEADLVAQPDAVGVGDDGGLAEHIAHDQVCALAPHAGQGKQFVKGVRHPAVVLVPQHPYTSRDVPRLGVSQPAGLDDGFNVLRFGGSQRRHTGVFCKQLFHHNVHPGIRALGGQPHADQQLPCVVVVQRAPCIWVFSLETPDDLQRQHFFCGKVLRGLFSYRHGTNLL